MSVTNDHERSLKHNNGEAEKFYRDLKARGISVRVGMETTGYSRWFERLLAELGFDHRGVNCRCCARSQDRGGLAEWEQIYRKKKAKVCLDINRSSEKRVKKGMPGVDRAGDHRC